MPIQIAISNFQNSLFQVSCAYSRSTIICGCQDCEYKSANVIICIGMFPLKMYKREVGDHNVYTYLTLQNL